jgi:hypothetical protein
MNTGAATGGFYNTFGKTAGQAGGANFYSGGPSADPLAPADGVTPGPTPGNDGLNGTSGDPSADSPAAGPAVAAYSGGISRAGAAGGGAAGSPTGAPTKATVNGFDPTSSPTGAPTAPSTPGVLSGPGYEENWYATHGNDNSGPTNSQKLYDEGASATNPAYQNAMDMANRQINRQEWARGGLNSGAALEAGAMADANLMGTQAIHQGELAGQADTANTTQFNSNSAAAKGAQDATNTRIQTITGGTEKLSADQAHTVDNFYQMAETGQLTADMASIEAQMQAAGVDAATAQALASDITSLAAAGIKAGSK